MLLAAQESKHEKDRHDDREEIAKDGRDIACQTAQKRDGSVDNVAVLQLLGQIFQLARGKQARLLQPLGYLRCYLADCCAQLIDRCSQSRHDDRDNTRHNES